MLTPISHHYNDLTKTIASIKVNNVNIIVDLKVNSFDDCQRIVKAVEKAYWHGRKDMKEFVLDTICTNTPRDI